MRRLWGRFWGLKWWIKWPLIVIVVLIIIGAVAGGSSKDENKQATAPTAGQAATAPASTAAPASSPSAEATAAAAAATPPPTPAPTPSPTPAPPPQLSSNAPIAPGAQIKVGGLIITLNEVRDPAMSTNQFIRPKAGERFVAIDITYTADNDNYSYNTLFDWKVQDGQAFTYSADLSASTAVEPFLGTGKLANKGDQARGFVGFAVKEGATIRAFIFQSFTSTNQGKFETR